MVTRARTLLLTLPLALLPLGLQPGCSSGSSSNGADAGDAGKPGDPDASITKDATVDVAVDPAPDATVDAAMETGGAPEVAMDMAAGSDGAKDATSLPEVAMDVSSTTDVAMEAPPNLDGGTDVAPTTDAGSPGAPTSVVAAGVRWFGRVDTSDPAKPRFSWSGTGFVARFMGTSLSATLSVGGAAEIFKTVVDDMPQPVFTAQAGQKTYPLTATLAAGVHTVALYRQTEGPQGETQLAALSVAGGALMDPPGDKGRLIEIVGDSITCGYGDLGTLNDSECYSTESHWDTYEAVTARALNADVSTIAASGRGIIRNYGGDTTDTMPMVYDRALANVAGTRWDFRTQPQAVVINLGTNDISNNKGDPGGAFRDTYVTLLKTIRSKYPDAWIVGIIGPLLDGNDLKTISGYVKDAVAMRTAAGDQQVEFFDKLTAQSSDKAACQYHPNVAENKIMADLLTAELRAKLHW